MENASKALLIAGGVLISVLIIGVFIMVYSNMTSLSNSKGQILEAEQLAEYNKQWESYNRDDLRGADVISIINKALDTNEKYRDEINDDMINIYIEITEPIGKSTEKYKLNTKTGKYERDGKIEYEEELSAGTYSIKNNEHDLKDFASKANEEDKESEIIPTDDGYEKIYYEFATFKLMTEFKCANIEGKGEYKEQKNSGIKYDDFGRIAEIHLRQTSLKN